MSDTLTLPADLSIYAVAEWSGHLRNWLETASRAPEAEVAGVDGSAVEDIDGAGLQLLISLANGLQARGLQLQLRAPSERLRQACRAMALDDLLAPDAQEETAA